MVISQSDSDYVATTEYPWIHCWLLLKYTTPKIGQLCGYGQGNNK